MSSWSGCSGVTETMVSSSGLVRWLLRERGVESDGLGRGGVWRGGFGFGLSWGLWGGVWNGVLIVSWNGVLIVSCIDVLIVSCIDVLPFSCNGFFTLSCNDSLRDILCTTSSPTLLPNSPLAELVIGFTPCCMRVDSSIIRSDGMLPREELDFSRGNSPVEANGFLGINSSLLIDLSSYRLQPRQQRGRTDLAKRSDLFDLLHNLLLCGVEAVLVNTIPSNLQALWNEPPTLPPYPCEYDL